MVTKTVTLNKGDVDAMIKKGKAKYEANVDADEWRTCGKKGGMGVAACLKGKKEALSTADWAAKWGTAMEQYTL